MWNWENAILQYLHSLQDYCNTAFISRRHFWFHSWPLALIQALYPNIIRSNLPLLTLSFQDCLHVQLADLYTKMYIMPIFTHSVVCKFKLSANLLQVSGPILLVHLQWSSVPLSSNNIHCVQSHYLGVPYLVLEVALMDSLPITLISMCYSLLLNPDWPFLICFCHITLTMSTESPVCHNSVVSSQLSFVSKSYSAVKFQSIVAEYHQLSLSKSSPLQFPDYDQWFQNVNLWTSPDTSDMNCL